MTRTHAVLPSPIGPLTAVRDDGVLVGLTMGTPPAAEPLGRLDDAAFADVREQLAQYFDGSRTSFELPLRASGNPLQLAVWQLIADIPYGTTRTYGDLARDLGDRT